MSNNFKKHKNEISKSVSQRNNGEKIRGNIKNEEISIELQRRIRKAQKDARIGKNERDTRIIDNKVIFEYANETGTWIDNLYDLGDFFIGGNENNLAYDDKNGILYKSNNLLNSGSFINFLHKIKIHNKLFPETRYDFVGFTGISINVNLPYVEPIYRQDFIKNAVFASTNEIDDYMNNLGFIKIEDYKYKINNIEVWDLRPRNVLKDENGNIYIIDAEFKKIKKTKLEMKKEKNKQLEKGIEVEKEHIDTIEKIASGEIKPEDAPKAIAEDHLDEDKKYYDKLEEVENKTENINLSKEDYDKKKDEITDAIKRFKANFIINSLIGELGEIVNINPNLFSDYVSFCMSLQKKYRPYFDIYDKEFGMPKVVQWLDENKKTIFDVIELKDYSLPKYKSFSTIPEDKIFMDIHSKFASKDSLRLKFLGTNFSDKGVVTTNSKILLFTKYRGSETNLGNYCHTKTCFENESEVKSQGYVDYQSIVPREGERIEVKSEAIYDYLRNVDNYRLYDKIKHSVCILLKDEFFYFNTDYLIESLETMSKLGHNHLEISYSRPNRAVMICPRGRVNDCENLQADFIIIMPILNHEENPYEYDLNKNCYIDRSKNEYCFDGEIKEKIKLKNKVEELEKTIEVLKSTKKVDDKKEDEEIIEIKDDTKSKNVDLEEISGALETLKMLVEVGGTDDEIKEWNIFM